MGGDLTKHEYRVRKKSRAKFLFDLQVYFIPGEASISPISVGGKIANAFPCLRKYHANPFRGKNYMVSISKLTAMISVFDCGYFQGVQKVTE